MILSMSLRCLLGNKSGTVEISVNVNLPIHYDLLMPFYILSTDGTSHKNERKK